MACPMTYNGVNLSRSDSQYTRNTRNATNPSHISRFFLLRNIQGNLFENANICISPTFQETVGRHLRPSLTVFAMGTLNQFNSNLFVTSVNNSPLAKISRHYFTHAHTVL